MELSEIIDELRAVATIRDGLDKAVALMAISRHAAEAAADQVMAYQTSEKRREP